MGMKSLLISLFIGLAAGQQNFRICIPSNDQQLCNSLDRDGQVTCNRVESRIDCAIRLARGQVDIGVFNEEETLLLGQQQPNDNRVVATIRDVARTEPFAFEAVAVVSNTHSGGLEGLRGARYCHPGFDHSLRWSPRVLRAFEQAVVRTDRCSEVPPGRIFEELEVEQLNNFFNTSCRPGAWSVNETIDASLKSRFPSLCSLCGVNSSCESYNIDMGVSVAGVNNYNSHIQALQCARNAGANRGVAYVAWQHVREYFNIHNPGLGTSFALICPDGTTRPLTNEILGSSVSPCAFVRQPWPTVIATSANAASVQQNMRSWWPNGANAGGNTWQSTLFTGVIGGANARVFFEEGLPTPSNYTSGSRTIPAQDATATCIPARRWCTLSELEHIKCQWVRAASYSLGIEPTISCQLRSNMFQCMDDIKENRADFVTSSSHYGYLARQHYQLSPVKLLLNSKGSNNSFSRVAIFVKETAAQSNVTRFENLRGKNACFPEYGGIAYVSFVRAAQERGIVSASECDYARAVGDFFESSCAGGALDAAHALTNSNYNATSLCTLCRSRTMKDSSDFTCAWDWTNAYFGNNGTMACLADPSSHVAILELTNIRENLAKAGLQANQLRALCRDNTLAASTGIDVDDRCLLSLVVDAEVITRRNDPLNNALSVLLETLDLYFGYNRGSAAQFINLDIFSPFDGVSDLLFKDTAIGFTLPTASSPNTEAKNYIELFQHLESCTGSATPGPVPGLGARHLYSIAMIGFLSYFAHFVIN